MKESKAKYIIIENRPFVGNKGLGEAVSMAIQALEEIQQYRAIGTVEELKQAKAIYNEILLSEAKLDVPKECIAYEVGKSREKELREYKAIGTIEELQVLKEKSEKKRFKVFESHGMRQFVCGCCDRPILATDNYCSFCGQKLDWQ